MITMTGLEHEATEVGRDHGWAHAVYVKAYGGDLNATPNVPLFYRHVRARYLAGYARGMTDYEAERKGI